jgi:hypothetical protein
MYRRGAHRVRAIGEAGRRGAACGTLTSAAARRVASSGRLSHPTVVSNIRVPHQTLHQRHVRAGVEHFPGEGAKQSGLRSIRDFVSA